MQPLAAEPEDEAPTAEAAMPRIVADADGWPTFEEELPEESVAPEREPPTEEMPALDPSDPAGERAAAASADGREPRDERRGRRRRGGRGRRRAEDEPRGERPQRDERPGDPHPNRTAADRERAEAGFGPEGSVLDAFADAAVQPVPDENAPQAPARDEPRRGPSRAALHFFHPERLDACQRAIGYHFRDVTLLENALTHSSIKSDDRPSYERMEFLGDSVVGLVISEYLYTKYPEYDEGDLTKLKSIIVSTDGLANAAKVCGLDRFLAVGRGLLMKEAVPRSLIADVFEGVAGAVYLDRGYEAARLYILDHLKPFVDNAQEAPTNYKSVLQQVAQRDLGETPHYDTLREWGPEHTRQFEVVAVLGRRRFPAGRGPTKKDAEQAAAKIAIQVILLERGHGAISRHRRDHAGGGRREHRPPHRR